METIQCYLCGGDAREEDRGPDGKLINCGSCLEYQLTTGAMLFYFNKTDKGGLDREACGKLINYIKDRSYPNVGEAVKLSAGIINEVRD